MCRVEINFLVVVWRVEGVGDIEERQIFGMKIFNPHEDDIAGGGIDFVEIIKNILNYYPILLLDDIASELDKKNTEKIFSKDIIDKQQTFIAIINKDDLPRDILDNAQLFNLNDL